MVRGSLIVLVIGLFLAGCSTTKHLPENEKLYTGADVNVSGPNLTTKEKKVLRSDLEGLTRPEPNSRFLGIPFKLNIYNLFRNAKPNSFFGKIRDKNGEPPVLLSQVDLETNEKVLRSHLENKGWFHAKVEGDTSVKNKKAKAIYDVAAGPQYTIDSVAFPSDSTDLALAIAGTMKNTLLTIDAPFDIDVIKAERNRIDAKLKEQGFYFFSPEYILIKADSTIGEHKVDVFVTIKPEIPTEATQIYRINDVYIYSDYSLNTAEEDTLMGNAEEHYGFYIIDKNDKYKPKLFDESMQFRSGEVYNRTDHNQTLSRLINLNIFKFVKNRFEIADTAAPLLDAYYYLTALPAKSLNAEVGVISRSNNLNGSQFNFSHLSRNLFRNGSQLSLSAYVGSDVQFSGALKGYNTYRTGAEVVYAAPRFFTPFFRFKPRGPYAPRTNLRFGYDILNRKNLYTLNTFRFEYGYSWKKNIQIQHELHPISISYTQALNVTDEFKDLQNIVFGLNRAVEQQLILGSRYEYLYNQQANNLQPTNSFFFNGIVDLSGNIAGLMTGANAKAGDTAFIRGVPFSQYVKVQSDFRYYRKIGLRSTWANRIDIGVGYPYGNSTQLPYIKQFFVGGNNSLRGFRSRSVGPGTYHPVNPNNLIPDQTGDLKLELNTEFRPHISGPLFGALFIDAGNIWLVNDEQYTGKPGSQFSGNFLKELAVDAGVGIRLDITIFVIRFDVAFPLRKPWEQNPWVMNQINLGNQKWRQENIVYNLAIGYPF